MIIRIITYEKEHPGLPDYVEGRGSRSKVCLRLETTKSAPFPPLGVFNYSRGDGSDTFTWQPRPQVRIATVARRVAGPHPGFLPAGRSLRPVPRRSPESVHQSVHQKEIAASRPCSWQLGFISWSPECPCAFLAPVQAAKKKPATAADHREIYRLPSRSDLSPVAKACGTCHRPSWNGHFHLDQ